jgi:cytochrome P450
MALAAIRQVEELPVMTELGEPDWGVDFRWVTEDLFARDYKGLMRSPWGDVVAYHNADVEALVAHPQVSHQTFDAQVEPLRPPGTSGDSGFGRFMRASTFAMRPPDHGPVKKLTTRALTPKSVGRFSDAFTTSVRSRLDEIVGQGEIDFVTDFIRPAVVGFWGSALGMSPDEVNHVIGLSEGFMLSFLVAPDADQIVLANRASDAYMETLGAFVGRAMRSADYPLVGELARQHAALDGAMQTESAEDYFAAGLQDGFHTLRGVLASCVFTLVEAGVQPARQTDPMSFAGPAFDEAVRLHSAVTFTQRQATADFVHDGVLIPRDTNISMMWLFSNRDPEVFDEPMEYRLDRTNRSKQFGFGGGPYVCAGRNLARALGELLLAELVRASVTIEAAGESEWVPGSLLHGLKTFPVVLSRG